MFTKRHCGSMVGTCACLRIELPGFEPCSRTLRCVLRQDTSLSQCLSVQVYKWVPAKLNFLAVVGMHCSFAFYIVCLFYLVPKEVSSLENESLGQYFFYILAICKFNFRNANHSTENSGYSATLNVTEIPDNKPSKIQVYLAKIFLFPEISIPFPPW